MREALLHSLYPTLDPSMQIELPFGFLHVIKTNCQTPKSLEQEEMIHIYSVVWNRTDLDFEPLLAPNPHELDNNYLDAVNYDDEEEPYEDLDDDEEDLEENPEMDLDKEEVDLEMDIDDEEEEEPLPASPPPLSLLRTPPLVPESSSDFDIPVTTTTNVGRPFKSPLSTYESANISATLAAIDRDQIEKTQDQNGKQIRELRHYLTSTEIRLEVAKVDRYRLEYELYNARVQIHDIQQEMYWRGFKENRPTESIDTLATYGDADPPELQEPFDTK
ncbi:hypothetical protein Tco_0351594 [Tanacetum coccineum]